MNNVINHRPIACKELSPGEGASFSLDFKSIFKLETIAAEVNGGSVVLEGLSVGGRALDICGCVVPFVMSGCWKVVLARSEMVRAGEVLVVRVRNSSKVLVGLKMFANGEPQYLSKDFNHHGFGVAALEAIAAALNHDVGGCGFCDPDTSGEPCVDEHFYPHAESALRGLACVLEVPHQFQLTDQERRVMEGTAATKDHAEVLEVALAVLSAIGQEYAGARLNPAQAKCLGAELFLRSRGEEVLAMHYTSKRGHPLIFTGIAPEQRSILTVENYPKWYGFQLVHPDARVEEVGFGVLHELALRRGVSPYVDHVPNALLVPELAEAEGWLLDSVSYEVMVGRWEAEVVSPQKYDF